MSRGKAAGPEAGVLRACLDLLELRGIWAWRNNVGCLRDRTGRPVRYGLVGSSDIFFILGPYARLGAIETKAPGIPGVRPPGRPTEAQGAFLRKVRAMGGVALVIHDVAVLARVLDILERSPRALFGLDGEREGER